MSTSYSDPADSFIAEHNSFVDAQMLCTSYASSECPTATVRSTPETLEDIVTGTDPLLDISSNPTGRQKMQSMDAAPLAEKLLSQAEEIAELKRELAEVKTQLKGQTDRIGRDDLESETSSCGK